MKDLRSWVSDTDILKHVERRLVDTLDIGIRQRPILAAGLPRMHSLKRRDFGRMLPASCGTTASTASFAFL